MQRSDLSKGVSEKIGAKAQAPKKAEKRDRNFMIRLIQAEYDAVMSFWQNDGLPAATGCRQLILKHIRRQGG